MKKTFLFALLTLSLSAHSSEGSTFTDPRDKQRYKTVKIGNQTWMAQNLNYKDSTSKCYENNDANWGYNSKSNLLSVRCVED